jgi:beta-N-acetylhexosaminidase
VLSRGRARLTRPPPLLAGSLLLCVALAPACGQGSSIHLISNAKPQTRSASSAKVTSRSARADPPKSVARASPSARSASTGGAGEASSPAAGLSTSRAIGQMLMSHVTGPTASAHLLARIRDGQVGSVILYSENIESDSQLSRLTSSLQQAALAGGNPPLLIGTDQEGGSVKRLRNSPPTMSAEQMGASAEPFAVAQSQGRATGVHLRRLGINLDFAPVSDIPTTSDNFLQDRAFGHTRSSVVEGASGFARGLAEAHVAASAKHFPGLGGAGARDSDFTLVSIDISKGQLQEGYAPYLAMSQLGSALAPMVMISDASYPALDPSGLPAVLSRKIIQTQLAVAGMSERVTITDDLEVPSVMQYADAAVRAVQAGDDILMFAQHEAGSEAAYRAIDSALASHTLSKSAVTAAAASVIGLKQTVASG